MSTTQYYTYLEGTFNEYMPLHTVIAMAILALKMSDS